MDLFSASAAVNKHIRGDVLHFLGGGLTGGLFGGFWPEPGFVGPR